MPAVRCMARLDLFGGEAVVGVLGKLTVSATALEQEENDQELPKMPKEPTMAARTLEERELTGGNSPDKKRKEHADEELWREHRKVDAGVGDNDC